MGDLSEHFNSSEFACKCGCGTAFTINPSLLEKLEGIRKFLNRPIEIASGFRCPTYNVKVGGVSDSVHPDGNAADIRIETSGDRMDVVIAVISMGFLRIGVAKTFIHVDVSKTLPQDKMWLYP